MEEIWTKQPGDKFCDVKTFLVGWYGWSLGQSRRLAIYWYWWHGIAWFRCRLRRSLLSVWAWTNRPLLVRVCHKCAKTDNWRITLDIIPSGLYDRWTLRLKKIQFLHFFILLTETIFCLNNEFLSLCRKCLFCISVNLFPLFAYMLHDIYPG